MTETQAVIADKPKSRRGWPKGKPRKPPLGVMTAAPFPVEAPIHVRLRIKDYGADIEFGCARRLVENGFHVFFYPSKRDPYRETRREFSIAQIIEIEITEARQVYDFRPGVSLVQNTVAPEPFFNNLEPVGPARPVIHSAKDNAMKRIAEKLERDGPVKLDTIPGISFGGSAG